MISRNNLPRFSRNLLISFLLLIMFVSAFVAYVIAEKKIDRANYIRHNSLLLANELRQSSDDLTRLVRTYVFTGKIHYKRQYQEILDIRDGRKPRPEGYWRIYWDLMPISNAPPRSDSAHAVPLLELMRHSDFTEWELAKLTEAKQNSDLLAVLEIEAMKLSENTGSDSAKMIAKAQTMLYDERYHLAKAAIMKPIDDFYESMDKRTDKTVQSAEFRALVFRYVFMFFSIWLMFVLWRFYKAESKTQLQTIDRERKESVTALQVSQYTRSLIEASLDPLVTISPDGMITDVNEATEKATGCSRNELIGSDFSSYFTDKELACYGYQQVFRAGHVQDYYLELRHRNGSVTPVLYNASVYRDIDGNNIGVFAAARDITRRKQVEEALHEKTLLLEQEIGERQQAQEALAVKQLQLEAINRTLEERVLDSVAELRLKDQMMIQQSRQAAMGEMINNIAHQWKQPLNNLGLILQSMAYEFNAGVLTLKDMEIESKKCMDLIGFMAQTIDDFRSFFREDKEMKTFGIRQSISRAIRLVSASLMDHNIKVVVEPGDEIQVNGYSNEYAQVLLNLLGNARDVLLDRQVVDPVIIVKASKEDDGAVVTIRDNGGGIAAGIMEYIFDPYFTTKEPGKGTGIGLFMSKTIIEKNMGGSLSVSNVENGACFKVKIGSRFVKD